MSHINHLQYNDNLHNNDFTSVSQRFKHQQIDYFLNSPFSFTTYSAPKSCIASPLSIESILERGIPLIKDQ